MAGNDHPRLTNLHSLIERLRVADRDSVQRVLGSRIFADAADELERLQKALETIFTANTACDGDYRGATYITCDLAHKALGYESEPAVPK